MKKAIPPRTTRAPIPIPTAAPPLNPESVDVVVVGLTIGAAGAVVLCVGVGVWGTPGLSGFDGLAGLNVGAELVLAGAEPPAATAAPGSAKTSKAAPRANLRLIEP